MSTYFVELAEAIAGVSDDDIARFYPLEELGDGDHAVGELPNSLKALYVVLQLMQRDAAIAFAHAMFCTPADREKNHTASMEAMKNVEVTADIFWICCRHEFPCVKEKRRIGLRSGWKLVWSHYIEPDSIEDVYRSIKSSSENSC